MQSQKTQMSAYDWVLDIWAQTSESWSFDHTTFERRLLSADIWAHTIKRIQLRGGHKNRTAIERRTFECRTFERRTFERRHLSADISAPLSTQQGNFRARRLSAAILSADTLVCAQLSAPPKCPCSIFFLSKDMELERLSNFFKSPALGAQNNCLIT